MSKSDDHEATFEAHRPLLFSIAYRMLGSASEAEAFTVTIDHVTIDSKPQPPRRDSRPSWRTRLRAKQI